MKILPPCLEVARNPLRTTLVVNSLEISCDLKHYRYLRKVGFIRNGVQHVNLKLNARSIDIIEIPPSSVP